MFFLEYYSHLFAWTRLDTSHRILKIQLLFSDTSCWPWVTSFVSPCCHQEVLHVAQVEMQLAACAAFLQVLQRQLVPVQNYTQTFLQSILVGIDSREPGKIITLPSSPSYPPACPVIWSRCHGHRWFVAIVFCHPPSFFLCCYTIFMSLSTASTPSPSGFLLFQTIATGDCCRCINPCMIHPMWIYAGKSQSKPASTTRWWR